MEEDENGERDDTGLFEDEDSSAISSEKTRIIPTNEEALEDRVEEFDNEPTSKANKFQKNLCEDCEKETISNKRDSKRKLD